MTTGRINQVAHGWWGKRPKSRLRLLRAKMPGLAGPLHSSTRPPRGAACESLALVSFLLFIKSRTYGQSMHESHWCYISLEPSSQLYPVQNGREAPGKHTTHRICPRLSAELICGTMAADARLDRAGTVCL